MATTQVQLEKIAQRLTDVEKEVAELKEFVQRGVADGEPWYLKHAGKFKDDPDFEEIIRLGREIRQADRP
jgi:hypothetical protein